MSLKILYVLYQWLINEILPLAKHDLACVSNLSSYNPRQSTSGVAIAALRAAKSRISL